MASKYAAWSDKVTLAPAVTGMRWETDRELYVRINAAYGRWGAFLGEAMEARGYCMDECAKHVKLTRKQVPDGE